VSGGGPVGAVVAVAILAVVAGACAKDDTPEQVKAYCQVVKQTDPEMKALSDAGDKIDTTTPDASLSPEQAARRKTETEEFQNRLTAVFQKRAAVAPPTLRKDLELLAERGAGTPTERVVASHRVDEYAKNHCQQYL
jgi:hypothetical protein